MIENTPLTVQDLLSRHDAVKSYFDTMWTSGAENELYKKAVNWSDTKKALIEGQNRVAYAVPLMASKINQVIVYQQNNRTDFKVRAVLDPNDEIKAEIGNVIFKDFENQNNFKYIESEAFDSGVSVKYGVTGIYIEKDEEFREVVKVRDIDYKNFVWDCNATTYTKKDALFMAELEKVYRYQIREEYGKEAAKKVTIGNDYAWGRAKDAYYISPNVDNEDFDVITRFKHYEKVLRDYYIILFNDYANLNGLKDDIAPFKFRNKKTAKDKLKELQLPYLMKGLPLGQNEIVKDTVIELDKYIFTIDGILEFEETDMVDFPYGIYQAYHFKDQVWSLADLLKSMQIFVDRYLSQIDYSLAKDIKNVYEIAINQLGDGITYEKALEIMEDSGVLPVKMTGAVKAVRGQGINPQWIQMIQVMKEFLEDLSGGRSFQGLSNGANQSGVAEKERRQQGEMVAALFLDNLKRWKKDLGEKLMWFWKKYDTAERVVKVGGGDLSPEMLQVLQSNGIYSPSMTGSAGYLKINSHPLTFLKDSKFELVVSDSPTSETRKQQRFVQLAAVGQIIPIITQLPEYTELLLDAQTDLDYDTRKKLVQGVGQMFKAQAEAAQKESQREDMALQIEASKIQSGEKQTTQKTVAGLLTAQMKARSEKRSEKKAESK